MTRALVFDSGVGGLSVVGEIRARLPALALDYAADDAFRPYGARTRDELRARLPGLVRGLADASEADLVVVACNTASTAALDAIRAHSRAPVVGVVPAVKPAAERTRTGVIGVLGTPATVRQDYVDELVRDFARGREVRRLGSTALVDMAERKLRGEGVDVVALRDEIAPLFGAGLDTVVLACTHFPLLADELALAAPHTVTWIDSGEAIARRVEALLGDVQSDNRPDTALSVGGAFPPARAEAFRRYGFGKTVVLPSA